MNLKYGFVCCGYNCLNWVDRSLASMLLQTYNNFKIICIDAQSTDGTYEKLKNYEEKYTDKIQVIRNNKRQFQTENTLLGVKEAKDCDIIITVDLDDWLSTNTVLEILNNYYLNNNIWMTYGTYCHYPYQDVSHHYHDFPYDVKLNGTFKKYPKWLASHLRTFKRDLFLKINEVDLKDENGNYFDMAGDNAFMFPMLEMARERTMHLKEILYVYNRTNPISEDRVNVARQEATANYIRQKSINDRLDTL
jgi:glycosyltransferase involved in cell wall biosynthesis